MIEDPADHVARNADLSHWDDGEGKRNKAWWIITGDPEAGTAWLKSEIYRGESSISVVNVPPDAALLIAALARVTSRAEAIMKLPAGN